MAHAWTSLGRLASRCGLLNANPTTSGDWLSLDTMPCMIIKLPPSRPILMAPTLGDTTPLAIGSEILEAGDITYRWTNVLMYVSHSTLQPVDKLSDKIIKHDRQVRVLMPTP